MRIALIAPLPPEQNGIADYADAFKNALTNVGVQVDTPLKGIISGQLSHIDSLMRSVDWTQYDLVHGELGGGRSGEFLALDWLRRHFPNLPVTSTVHDPERLIWRPATVPALIRKLPPMLYKFLVLMLDPWTVSKERGLAQRVSKLVTLTRTGRDCLVNRMRLRSEAVVTIPHGNQSVDLAPLPELPPTGPLKILYFGFIYRGKGIEDLIDAIALLLQQRPSATTGITLTLAGGTKPDIAFGASGSYLDTIKARLDAKQIAQLNLDWQLDVPKADIPALLQRHHIVVLPYIETKKLTLLGKIRGTSGVLSWAAACGRGVIISDARAFSEEASYGNGLVFSQGNVEALTSQLSTLLDSPQRIVDLADAAYALGQKRQWRHVAEQFKTLFEQVIANA